MCGQCQMCSCVCSINGLFGLSAGSSQWCGSPGHIQANLLSIFRQGCRHDVCTLRFQYIRSRTQRSRHIYRTCFIWRLIYKIEYFSNSVIIFCRTLSLVCQYYPEAPYKINWDGHFLYMMLTATAWLPLT